MAIRVPGDNLNELSATIQGFSSLKLVVRVLFPAEEATSYTYPAVLLLPYRADYQRISEEIQRRSRKPPPPLPPSDPRTPPHRMEPTLPRQLPPRDRSRTVVGRPPIPPEGYNDFDVSAIVISWDMDSLIYYALFCVQGQLISYKQLPISLNLPHFDQTNWMNPAISYVCAALYLYHITSLSRYFIGWTV